MRRLLPAILLALLWAGPADAQQAGAQQILCGRSFIVSAGATAITQVVAPVSTAAIHICGIFINAGAAAGTYQLSTGTGTNCGTGTASITPAFSLGINGVMVIANTAAFYSSPVGNALCHTITGTGPINALVSYHQF